MAAANNKKASVFFIIFFLGEFPHVSSIKPLLRKGDHRPLCSCNINSKPLTTRVVGGHDAEQGQFPYATVLLRKDPLFQTLSMSREMPIEPFCGATLITDRHVVTAAHCIRDRHAKDILLDVSDFNIRSKEDGNKQYRQAIRLIHHPNYIKKTFNRDIGIIEFDRSIEFKDGVKTAWLPVPNSDFTPGSTLTVYGWGRLDYHGSSPDVLQTLDLPVVDRRACQKVFKTKITANMICAGGKYNKDACIGDSGSGLMSRMDNDYTLAGVVSFGKRCGMKYVPGIYARVSNFVNWIYQETKNATCQPCIASQDNLD